MQLQKPILVEIYSKQKLYLCLGERKLIKISCLLRFYCNTEYVYAGKLREA